MLPQHLLLASDWLKLQCDTVITNTQIHKVPQLDMLCTISGQYDLIAKVTEATTEALDNSIDRIATLDGVEKTLSHIVLSRKVDR